MFTPNVNVFLRGLVIGVVLFASLFTRLLAPEPVAAPAPPHIEWEWHGLCHAGDNTMFKEDCDAGRRWNI